VKSAADPQALAAYVDAACALQGFALTDERRARVVEQFARIAAIAEPLLGVELPADVEPASTFVP